MKTNCCYCGKEIEINVGQWNYRVVKKGMRVFCDRKCAGLGRRVNRTEEEEKFIKAIYDGFIRECDAEILRKKRHEFFKKDYAANPEKYRQQRIKRREEHAEYCRQPEYKKYKQDYDRKHRAKKKYGRFWEAAIALYNLQGIVDNRKAKQDSKTINKQQNRKRYAKKYIKRKELESCTVGFYQPR